MEKIIKVKQETHTAIKIASAKAGMTMQDFVGYLINKHNKEERSNERT